MKTVKCLYCSNVSPVYYLRAIYLENILLNLRLGSCHVVNLHPHLHSCCYLKQREQYTYLPINYDVLIDDAYLTALSVIQALVSNAWIIANFAVST